MNAPQLTTDDRRQDMLIGALEGGSNYWYYIKHEACELISAVQKPDNLTPFAYRMFAAIKAGKSIAVHDLEDEDNKLGEISLQSIEKGEATMLAQQPEHFADIISERDDASTADVWFQFCVMNEIVYG